MSEQQRLQREREDLVLRGLVEELSSRRGVQGVQLVENPDRLKCAERTFARVTTDALFKIEVPNGPEWWACDVMTLAAPIERKQVPDDLLQTLGPLTKEQGLVVNVTVGEIQDRNDYELRKQARQFVAKLKNAITAAPDGALQYRTSFAAWKATWSKAEAGEPGGLGLHTQLSQLWPYRQLAAVIRTPLIDKATAQAKGAVEEGCHAAVILDSIGHAGIRQGAHYFTKQPEVVRRAVEEVLEGVQNVLTAVLFLDRDSGWHLLAGEFPGFPTEGSG